jgi:hypothetical protein
VSGNRLKFLKLTAISYLDMSNRHYQSGTQNQKS